MDRTLGLLIGAKVEQSKVGSNKSRGLSGYTFVEFHYLLVQKLGYQKSCYIPRLA